MNSPIVSHPQHFSQLTMTPWIRKKSSNKDINTVPSVPRSCKQTKHTDRRKSALRNRSQLLLLFLLFLFSFVNVWISFFTFANPFLPNPPSLLGYCLDFRFIHCKAHFSQSAIIEWNGVCRTISSAQVRIAYFRTSPVPPRDAHKFPSRTVQSSPPGHAARMERRQTDCHRSSEQ